VFFHFCRAFPQATKAARDASVANFAKINPLPPPPPLAYPTKVRNITAQRLITRSMSNLSMGRTPSTADLAQLQRSGSSAGLIKSPSGVNATAVATPHSFTPANSGGSGPGSRRFFPPGSLQAAPVPEWAEWTEEGSQGLRPSHSARRFLPAHRTGPVIRNSASQPRWQQVSQGVLETPANRSAAEVCAGMEV
jgi:hypothetical protein